MDKAEKLKAARKKLKEFQSHKQEPHEVAAGSEDQTQEPQQQFTFQSIDPPTTSETFSQQQQTTFASSAPQIANYFDGGSGPTFDITQQQQNEFPAFAAPQQMNQIPTNQFPAVNMSQQFYATAPIVQPQYEASFPTPAPQFMSTQPTQFDTASQAPQFYAMPPPVDAQFTQQLQAVQKSIPSPFAQHIQQPEQFQPLSTGTDRAFELQQLLEQQNLQMNQLKSELEFHRMTATNLQKNTDELNKLRQEGHSHVDVVKVLVSEKSSLIDSLHKSELMVKAKFDENEELQNRLNASRHRVKQLESEVRTTSTKSSFDTETDARKVEEIIALKIKEFKDSNDRVEVEKDELKILLNQKRIELENLQKNFDHLNTELHLANVKISQLSDGSPVTEAPNQPLANQLTQEVAIKQLQITELYSIIDQVNRDKEASDNQYQNYVSHLTKEMEALKQGSIELTNENDSLVEREQRLLKHVGDLERQIQQQIQKQKTYAEDQKDSSSGPSQEELHNMSSQITALTESNESLKLQIGKIEAEKAELSQNLMMKDEAMRNVELQMEKLSVETPNLSRLMTDFEDKSVAASRALSQNQGLKEQLDEMQRAFITMTNDKMELTERLQSEMHLCKEMKIRYDTMEVDLKEMKDKWQYKEDEMIRLSHENTELEKKIIQHSIELDRLRHYESTEYRGTEGIIDKELENYKRMVETLTNKINILQSNKGPEQKNEHDHHHDHDHNHDGHGHSHSHGHSHDKNETEKEHKRVPDDSKKHLLEEIEMLKMEKNELLKAINDFQMSKKIENGEKPLDAEIITNGTPRTPEMNEETLRKLTISKSVTPSMATEEALEKLQSRFRRTMLEVAELTEEKQRLEHVVTQLQFETETIGEYITLYQYQRRMLKQKEHERDVQLKNLAADREKMNDKLVQLNGLIEKFVLQHADNIEFAKEATNLLDLERGSQPLIFKPDSKSNDMAKLKQETAGKILEILSDIKTANSASYDSDACIMEHCSCCLGKLETV